MAVPPKAAGHSGIHFSHGFSGPIRVVQLSEDFIDGFLNRFHQGFRVAPEHKGNPIAGVKAQGIPHLLRYRDLTFCCQCCCDHKQISLLISYFLTLWKGCIFVNQFDARRGLCLNRLCMNSVLKAEVELEMEKNLSSIEND
jgi:hypothetical protein